MCILAFNSSLIADSRQSLVSWKKSIIIFILINLQFQADQASDINISVAEPEPTGFDR